MKWSILDFLVSDHLSYNRNTGPLSCSLSKLLRGFSNLCVNSVIHIGLLKTSVLDGKIPVSVSYGMVQYMMCFLTFRVSSSTNYFLSELAYSPACQLENCKPLTLYVMTLGDTNSCTTAHICQHHVPSPADQSFTVNTKTSGCDCTLPVNCDHSIADDKTGELPPADKHHGPAKNFEFDSEAAGEFPDVENTANRLSKMLARECESGCFVLDIDLDFFSTLNPFLSSLAPHQYRLLSELYVYSPPLDRSSEVCINICFMPFQSCV